MVVASHSGPPARSPAAALALIIAALLAPFMASCMPGAAARGAAGDLNDSAALAPDGGLEGPTRVDVHIPRGAPLEFYKTPWPSELFRTSDGSLDWSRFPGARNPLVAAYLATAKADVKAFSVSPSIYFHFTSPPDRRRLPERPAATQSTRAPVFLADVDPKSPERGALIPLELRYFPSALRYVPAGTLAMKPVPGIVLRPGTLYAAVVRRDLGDAGGRLLGTTPDFERIKSTTALPDPGDERARSIHQEPLDYLASLGAARADIAAAAVFRTDVPHAVAERLFEAATSLPPEHAPRIASAAWRPSPRAFAEREPYSIITGRYCTPNFQSQIQDAPFLGGGGAIERDPQGVPRVAPIPPSSRYHTPECGGLIRARFVLTVPKSAPPPEGYPLLVVAHGTGGSAITFLGNDNFAGWAARQGFAAVSTDQPLHGADDELGARPGSRERRSLALGGILPLRLFRGQELGPEHLFYNPLNPAATRDNLRQAAIDASLLARLLVDEARGLEKAARPGGQRLLTPAPGRPIPRFDKTKILFAGHSQGSQSLAAAAAIDPLARGVILSGCGGDVRLGILERSDLAVMPYIEAALALRPEELSAFHPLMALAQALMDPVDPQSYGLLYREPLPGRRPQNAIHYAGLADTFNPLEAAGALATALRAKPIAPMPAPVPGLRALGVSPEAGPLQGNIAEGRATIAFVELAPTMGEDGHFVLFHEPRASALAMQFMKTAGGGPARLDPLAEDAGDDDPSPP